MSVCLQKVEDKFKVGN